MDNLEQRVAKAICHARHGPDTWRLLNEVERNDFLYQARMSIAAVREWDKEQAQPQLRFERVEGRDLEEFRENLYKTKLYQIGDTVLVWVNEGDLCSFYPPFSERHS